jgi:alanyl-tRNA synthetase
VISIEEERFNRTVDLGLNILNDIMAEVKAEGRTVIDGAEVFRLYDTYGFPSELTAEIATEQGLSIDKAVFEKEMAQQRERARASHKFVAGETNLFLDYNSLSLPATEFTGYEKTVTQARIVSIAAAAGGEGAAGEGQDVEVVLDVTPFYAEMGGQVADAGRIVGKEGWMEVADVIWARADVIVHRGKIRQGRLHSGDIVRAEVEKERRLDIARNHTATHLLQASLRNVLGEHVRQSGSLVTPERLRFDFTHIGEVSKEQLKKVQQLVNQKIRENLKVVVEILPYKEAIARGAIALFGEKYGETVRLVRIGDPPFSQELCGGTHLNHTGQIGFFYILSEGSIGAGLRRLEAVTGREAETLIEERMGVLDSLTLELKVSCDKAHDKVCSIIEELEKEQKRSALLERELVRRDADFLLKTVERIDGVAVLTAKISVSSAEALREMGDLLRDKLHSGIVVLGTVINDRLTFVAMVTSDLVAKGFHAGEIVKRVAKVAGGGGGGKADMAQAGAKDKSKLDAALNEVKNIIKSRT